MIKFSRTIFLLLLIPWSCKSIGPSVQRSASPAVKTVEKVQSQKFPSCVVFEFDYTHFEQGINNFNYYFTMFTPTMIPVFSKVFAECSDLLQGPKEKNESYPIYVNMWQMNLATHEYELMFATTPKCNGSSGCRSGLMSVKLTKSENDNSCSENKSWNCNVCNEIVTLENGTQGCFVEAQCGANCSDGDLYWHVKHDDADYLFKIGIKAGQKEDLIFYANNFIKERTQYLESKQ